MLQELRCHREVDLPIPGRGSEPYIWPVLVRIDEFTLQTDARVQVISPGPGNARVVIKDGMRAGDTAAIPTSVGLLRTRLEANLFLTRLILIVALWDQDETPEAAARAGFEAFVGELSASLGDFRTLLALKAAEEANDPAASQAIVDGIQSRVRARVETAIENSLTTGQKIAVATAFMNLDDFLGNTFKVFSSALPVPLNLRIGAGKPNDFEILGRLEAREVLKDRCQSQVDAVANARSTVNEVQKQIEALQAELQGASPQEKPFILAQIKELREVDLALALEGLAAAGSALSICRSRLPPTRPAEAERAPAG